MVKKEPYTFRVRVAVSSWHDGDTFYGALDQGVGIFRAGGMNVDVETGIISLDPIRHRAALIQAPELEKNGVEQQSGIDALNYAKQIAPPGIYECITYKSDDVFDRPLIDLILSSGLVFSTVMLGAGMAVSYKN